MTDAAPPAPTRTRARRTSPEKRRAQILDAAIAVFGKQGYRQGSLKTVADEVGLTIQGLLHYFPTKEELLLAALDHRNRATQSGLDDALATGGSLESCRFILRRNLENPGFMRLFVTLAAEATDPEHPAHSYFLLRYQHTFATFAQQLRADAALGRLAPGVEPDTTAAHLIALMDGLQLQYLLRPALDLVGTFDRATAALRASA